MALRALHRLTLAAAAGGGPVSLPPVFLWCPDCGTVAVEAAHTKRVDDRYWCPVCEKFTGPWGSWQVSK